MARSPTSAANSQNPATAAFKYAACIREHGVSSFPDPQVRTGQGRASIRQAVPASAGLSPRFAAAQKACKGIMPSPGNDGRTQADRQAKKRDLLAFAHCLRSHGIAEREVETVWTAIALHTTPGIPEHMHPVVALTTAGVEMDVLGLGYSKYPDPVREAVVAAFPRTPRFKEDIIRAFYDGIKHKPETTFGNVKADVLADKDPHFHRGNFCSVIRGSAWRG